MLDLSTLLVLVVFGAGVSGVDLLRRYHSRPPVVDPVPGTETWTVEEIEALRQGSAEIGTRFRRRVGIVATVGPGPDGVLTAPESGVECVWWRTERIRHHVRWDDGRRVEGTERIGHNWSRSAFTLTDETGTLVVRPADADVVGAPEVLSRSEEFEPDSSALGTLLGRESTTGVVCVEHALPVGATLFVHGEAHDLDERVITVGKPLDDGPLILSTRPEHTLRREAEDRRTAAETTRWSGYGLLALAALALVLLYAT